MKTAEKIFSFLYNVMGWATWLSVIALLVFTAVIFATGASREPEITVTDITVSEKTDGASGNFSGVYTVNVKLRAAGAKLSPYKYSVGGIKTDASQLPDNMKISDITAPVTADTGEKAYYSKAEPEDIVFSFTVTQNGATPDEIVEELKNVTFRFSQMKMHFSLFDFDITTGTPSFTAAKADGT